LRTCPGFWIIYVSLLDIENQNSVVSVTIKNYFAIVFFSHLDKYKPCLANGYPYNVSNWQEFVVIQINMTENYWLEKVTDTTKRGKTWKCLFLV